ncbi:MAG: phosphate ABC transporter permease PstA [Lentisphaeria bacterium]|jgi:phosphate transport system permease protein|nr:phosphate ABC transporter permease PstA [Lentisphaeria bacterium]
MKRRTRNVLDRSFTALGLFSILVMAAALVVLLFPIVRRGLGAYLFRATVEHRRVMFEQFGQGDPLDAELAEVAAARQPLFDRIAEYEKDLKEELDGALAEVRRTAETEGGVLGRSLARRLRRLESDASLEETMDTLAKIRDTIQEQHDRERHAALVALISERKRRVEDANEKLAEMKDALRGLLGPLPGDTKPELLRNHYGQTRWDRALHYQDRVLHRYTWDYSDPSQPGILRRTLRRDEFAGTDLEPLFPYLQENLEAMMRPRFTFYWRFLTTDSKDAHFFGGIWPEVLGTFYLTIGAMLFAIPMGVIAAIYLCEYARPTRLVSLLRSCISTLAGVPSIVFGLFGLAFFLNTIQISESKSVLTGSLTLALMILPTVIRASEEAILAVPFAYKEAAMGLGAGRWRTVLTVILPAALPGILTGIVISMGRAAGETAPIIFTAAVSVGLALRPAQVFSSPTPALPWNIYNLCTEHEAVDEIRHVQFGMVFTLVALVLVLNIVAILVRARIARKLRG